MKLTPEACRAGRALLGWNLTKLAARLLREESAAKIIAAFAAENVEITNGDVIGVRLRRR